MEGFLEISQGRIMCCLQKTAEIGSFTDMEKSVYQIRQRHPTVGKNLGCDQTGFF